MIIRIAAISMCFVNVAFAIYFENIPSALGWSVATIYSVLLTINKLP